MADQEGGMTLPATKRVLAPNAIHLVRTTLGANLQLSQMADQKASMLMGAAFLVFTLSVAQLRAGTMLLPIAILATAAFLAATCAILTVLPKVGRVKGPVGQDDNILFFGVFTSMSEVEFTDRVVASLHDDETMYRLMLRDIYQNGQVLQYKKYRYLGYAYRIFLGGLMLSFAVFAIELMTGRML